MIDSVRRKLIEVALPLEAINRESAREKQPFTRNHPRSLHIWWARRPLAACRAVLFAQLVDDPSANPEEFPSEKSQEVERKRLFGLIERMVVWENTKDETLWSEARAEIIKSTGGNPPPILDPFAGGGSIPLEAQRLGLEAHASDLNPVAVLINKALIEVPPKFADQPPVFPGAVDSRLGPWARASGLAEDVRRYGQWMCSEAEEQLSANYPKVMLHDGSATKVIAWIWARTVTCPNPACGAEIPLVNTWWLSKKKDRPTWIQPVVTGKTVDFNIKTDKAGPPSPTKQDRGAKFSCLVCKDTTTDGYIKSEAMTGRMGARLLAVVAEGNRRRIYLPASQEHVASAKVLRPEDVPEAPMPSNPRWFSPPAFGLPNFEDLFTDRQLVALTTFSDLVRRARNRVVDDATDAGWAPETVGAYADAVALVLGLAVSRYADLSNSICSWNATNEAIRALFARQAIPMAWDFAEANPFGLIGLAGPLEAAARAIQGAGSTPGWVSQHDAATSRSDGPFVVSTDPPYYDNIGYADLSDFFYVWLRRALGSIFPVETATILTPKTEEMIATPHRFGGNKADAAHHFERMFVRTFTHLREISVPDYPLALFYAFKQAESNDMGTASTGWETMLNGLMEAGMMVTATWPMRTERAERSVGLGTNALASSIVLACRPRPVSAEATNRRGFIAALKAELPMALRHMQQGSVAPVDLAQAAIGPGMAVFSRYARVVETDGSDMTVRTALALINQGLDEVLSEQEGDFDADTRFCVKWFSQYAWDEADSGTADTLSRATNTSLAGMQRSGVFRAVAGKARLIAPEELPEDWDPLADDRISVWEVAMHIANTLNAKGVDQAAVLMAGAGQRVDLGTVQELAYLLYNTCERRGWTKSAILFNSLGTSWSDLDAAARTRQTRGAATQSAFAFEDN